MVTFILCEFHFKSFFNNATSTKLLITLRTILFGKIQILTALKFKSDSKKTLNVKKIFKYLKQFMWFIFSSYAYLSVINYKTCI